MDTMFGVVIAALMRERKLENQDLKAKETRFHPDLPQHEDHRQFLTLVEDAEEDQYEEELDRLYTAVDASSDSSSSSAEEKNKKGSQKKKKENKRKKEKKTKDEREGDKDPRKDPKKQLEKDAKKALSDASTKIKASVDLSEKFRESVSTDVETKKAQLEDARSKLQSAVDKSEVTQSMIDDVKAAREGLETACACGIGPLERDLSEKIANGEAGGNTSNWTAKLATFSSSSRNHSRDFYRTNPLPVEHPLVI
ncbi:unnamed protein product [Durusdinium trenchii]|uniref:Uncharacterized protein n=1 Tax=Durusdinium trenchii TaxID=1381693 RepID=A0ABP0IIV4_9DINO